MSTALAIFVKTPGLSPVKTRLAERLGVAAAEQFHRLAAMAVGAVARSLADSVAPHWAVAEREGCSHAMWREFPTVWQGGGGLGDRLHRIYSALLERYDRVLLMGADSPQISRTAVLRSIATLDGPEASFVIGPAHDGGFWLFGGRATLPCSVWRSIAYSHARTCAELVSAIAPFGKIAQTERLHDVDTVEDLLPMQRALLAIDSPVEEQLRLAAWIGEQLPTPFDEHGQVRDSGGSNVSLPSDFVRNGITSSGPRRT